MVNVRFKVNGEVVAAKGEPGDSIMQVAVRQQLPSIEGECGGELSCATCHVYADTQASARSRRRRASCSSSWRSERTTADSVANSSCAKR